MAALVLAVRLLSELALLAAVALGAWSLDLPLAARVLLAVLAVLAVAAVWGRWVAPRAARRLPDPGRLGVEAVLFAGGVVGLVAAGRPVAAWALGAAAAVTAPLARRHEPAVGTRDTAAGW